jgi:hypothetical protein
MTLTGFGAALEHTNEIELTTTGRVTGKPISCPVWFVRRGGKLYLVPGDGTHVRADTWPTGRGVSTDPDRD